MRKPRWMPYFSIRSEVLVCQIRTCTQDCNYSRGYINKPRIGSVFFVVVKDERSQAKIQR
uniref:Uncharacterized protein n=1 Tax=Aegilops tauschii subsp. strangulata TaxID=200361 RepID=A0A453E909_AEGTS